MALSNVVIEKIDIAAFGGVSGKSISFEHGINLINADNEGGKSTVLAAIMFALYGFYRQSHSIGDNPKKKYTPWSGAAASVALTIGGSKRLRIERSVSGGKESALCTELTTGLPLYAGKVFGEEILGIGAETAEKTLFFSTVEPHQSKDEPLAAALQNLLFSADEQVSGEKAVKILNAHKNALKGRTGGTIPRLETEEAQLSEKLAATVAAAEECRRLETEAKQINAAIAAREAETEKAEKERENLQKYQASLLLEEYAELARRDSNAAAELSAFGHSELTMDYINRCRALKDEEQREAVSCAKLRAELAELGSDDGEDEALVPLAARCKRNKALAVASGVLCLLLGAAAVISLLSNITLPAIACGVAALLCAVFGLAMAMGCTNTVRAAGFSSTAGLLEAAKAAPERSAEKKARQGALLRSLKDAEARHAELLRQIKETGADGDTEAMLASFVELERLQAEKKNAAAALEEFKRKHDIDGLARMANGAVKPQKSAEQIETECRFASQASRLLREKLSPVLARLEALKMAGFDVSSTEEELCRKQQELEEAKLSYAALIMASECLTEAGVEMKASVSPRIAEQAGLYFAAATDGKYKGVELDTRLYMSVDGENGVKSAEHLSAGARDMAYLCFRLALVRLLYGDGSVPLILDDAFCRQDDTRLRSLLGVLADSGHQLIITSCTDREKTALNAMGIRYGGTQL